MKHDVLPEDVFDSGDDIFCLRLCELDGLGRRFKDRAVWLKFGDGRELGGIRRLSFLNRWNRGSWGDGSNSRRARDIESG